MRHYNINDIKEILHNLNLTKKDIQIQTTHQENKILKTSIAILAIVSCVTGFYNVGLGILTAMIGLTGISFVYLYNLGDSFVEKSLKKRIKFQDYENSIYEVLEKENAQKAILNYIIDSYNQNNPYLKLEVINELKLYLINKNYSNALLLISNMFNLIEDYQEEQKLISSYDQKLGLPSIIQEQEIELGGNVKWAKLL